MATFQSSNILSSSTCISSRRITRAAIHMPKFRINRLPKLPTTSTHLVLEELDFIRTKTKKYTVDPSPSLNDDNVSDLMVMQKLYAIMEEVADRVEMHKNIGEQRNNWNSLLLTSINTITLAAATMAGIAASSALGAPLMPLKLSSTLMYLAATGMLLILNKIQPSQLAEEQRNAARLFKQLHCQIQTLISIGNPTAGDVDEAMERVLALDKAYPLPLLGVMLEKFPSTVKPAVWWPQKQVKGVGVLQMENNGWNENLENEMREISGVLKRKDKDDYLRLGEKALKLNKVLAISGPLLTGIAAVGAAFVGPTAHGSCLAAVVAVAAGALASVVNTIEHGGQVGMVFEMYRSNAGFFRLLEESIERNLEEREAERRENGELFEMKVGLQLGRSLSQLKDLASASASASSKRKGEDIEEFASKLF